MARKVTSKKTNKKETTIKQPKVVKKAMVDAIAKDTTLDKKDCEIFYDSFVSLLRENLLEGKEVSLLGLFSIKHKTVKGRMGRNLQTGKPVNIPEKKALKFVVSNSLKDELNA